VISLQVGDCWLWSLIIFLIQRSCFSHVWTPLPDRGVWGGGGAPTSLTRGVQGGGEILEPPLAGGSGAAPPKRNFWENCLVKYCNFIVNLDRSL
jgi:hypothetical protein